VPPPTQRAGVEVKVDGETWPRERWDTPVPVDPGTHAIEVIGASFPKRTEQLTVKANADQVTWTAPVPLTAAPAASSSSSGAQTAEPAVPSGPVAGKIDLGPKEEAPSTTQRTVGLALGGVGAVGIVTGAVFGFLSISAHAQVVDRCPSYPTCPRADRAGIDDLNDRAQTTGNVSTIAFIAGAVLLAGGAALYFTAPSR
jgi:hypothetical protein